MTNHKKLPKEGEKQTKKKKGILAGSPPLCSRVLLGAVMTAVDELSRRTRISGIYHELESEHEGNEHRTSNIETRARGAWLGTETVSHCISLPGKRRAWVAPPFSFVFSHLSFVFVTRERYFFLLFLFYYSFSKTSREVAADFIPMPYFFLSIPHREKTWGNGMGCVSGGMEGQHDLLEPSVCSEWLFFFYERP
jgi:hypothetical protein